MKRAILLSLLAILTISTNAFADVKIKIRQTTAGQTTENTTLIKGKRQRSEMMSGQMISVTQCDFRRDLQLNPATKTYTVSAFDTESDTQPAAQSQTSNAPTKITSGGTLYITTTNKDTGERKQMFGYTARHIIQSIEMESSPDSCNPTKSKMEIDAWVIDETFGFQCDKNESFQSYHPQPKAGGCRDKIVSKTNGTAKSGYPLLQKMTFFDANGKESYTMTQEVLEISKATLEASLFDIPADYREVKSAAEMYTAASMNNVSMSSDEVNYTRTSANVQPTSSLPKTTSIPNSAPGAKAAGVVRLGLANVKVGAVGEGMNPNELAAAIGNSLADYLKGTKVEIVQLEAKLPSAINEEANDKSCDFVIFVNASHKKGGGGFGGFGKVLGQVVAQTGGGSWGNTTANVAGAVVTRTIVAATVSQNVKAKDEMTLDFKLQKATDNSAAFTKQFKGKAKSDGEDILSPIIEQVAQAILDTVKK